MPNVYVQSTMKIRVGGYERFSDVMAKQIPVLEAQGWSLVGAWSTIIGRAYSVVVLWKIPGTGSFLEATGEWRSDPAYAEFRTVTSEVLEEEQIALLTDLPFSPMSTN